MFSSSRPGGFTQTAVRDLTIKIINKNQPFSPWCHKRYVKLDRTLLSWPLQNQEEEEEEKRKKNHKVFRFFYCQLQKNIFVANKTFL